MKLEVRTSEDQWLPVCADQWDNKWSNFICQSFGYSRSVFTEYPTSGEVIGSSEIFMLKQGASISLPPGNGMRFPGMLQKGPSSLCSSGSIVEISCQEFTCGNHGLADGVAARLVGGDEAANGQWPSVALLYHTRERATCTGSIISPRWLIASYNCLHMREKSLLPDGWVAFGGGSTFDKDKPETQIRTVKSIVPYPQVKYNRFLYNHDVALVELMEPLTFTQSVGAICLPEKPIEPRQLCVTAGWGYTSPGEINFSQYLHYLPVPTIELNECNSTQHYSGFITEDKICAGFTDAMHSPCYNDEGAPLMCVSEGGIWELQGVLSYHSNCGRGYHPSIFSSVTSVREWVRRVVGGRFERRSTFNVRRRRGRRRRRSPLPRLVWT
ncbi:transmembrane protease serine 5-like [Hetaerina americana]|uniref:transmembrane protease serine 5-like n=1 Tax=Hetaerina americana TaxID=62018 RepID=UPI003A7F2BEB